MYHSGSRIACYHLVCSFLLTHCLRIRSSKREAESRRKEEGEHGQLRVVRKRRVCGFIRIPVKIEKNRTKFPTDLDR